MAEEQIPSSKKSKAVPFSKLQAGIILLLLLVAGWLLARHTTKAAGDRDPWVEILSQYNCAHHNDIPENLSDNSTGGCVKFAQFLLEVGASQFHVLGNSYDARTKAQVIDFQQRAGINQTGKIDRVTWAKLEGCVNIAASAHGGIWTCQQIKAY